MKQDDFVSISDIHIKSSSDPQYKYLEKFLNHPDVLSSSYIILLGDIFDILVGQYDEYIDKYKSFFNLLNKVLITKKVIWIEGNHDFHFKGILTRVIKKNRLKNIFYSKNPIVIQDSTNKIYVSHGDELDVKNINYIRYRNFIRSHYIQTIIDFFIPYHNAMKLRDRFAKNSRRMQRNFNEVTSRDSFREYAKNLQTEGFDLVITGHSHILDDHEGYYNNGYFPNIKKFLKYTNGEIKFVSLG